MKTYKHHMRCKRFLSSILAFTLGVVNLPVNMINVRGSTT